jgi:CheY-like chemotaxis protein
MHVLIVDDDVRSLERLQHGLSAAGFQVSTTDVAENLDSRIAIVGPDLVVLDVLMPGFSGQNLSRLLQGYTLDGDPRFVLLSPVPPNTLKALVDTSGAAAVVQVSDEPAFMDSLIALAHELLTGEYLPNIGDRPTPLVSGTHRIGGERIVTDPRELAQAESQLPLAANHRKRT